MILAPSKGIIGIMLKAASKEFIVKPNPKNAFKTKESVCKRKIKIKNPKAKTKLVRGPAKEIFPFLSVVILPLI